MKPKVGDRVIVKSGRVRRGWFVGTVVREAVTISGNDGFYVQPRYSDLVDAVTVAGEFFYASSVSADPIALLAALEEDECETSTGG